MRKTITLECGMTVAEVAAILTGLPSDAVLEGTEEFEEMPGGAIELELSFVWSTRLGGLSIDKLQKVLLANEAAGDSVEESTKAIRRELEWREAWEKFRKEHKR